MADLTPVQSFYKDKTVFITGASGFMGKVLIEKLLYSCSELKEVIILMRPKKGKVPETRLEEMFRLPVRIYPFDFLLVFHIFNGLISAYVR